MEHALEAGSDELHAHYPFAACLRLAYMDHAALGFEIGVFAARRRALQRDANLQVGAYGDIEACAKSGSAPAKIFTGGVFLELEAFCVLSPNMKRQAYGNSTFAPR